MELPERTLSAPQLTSFPLSAAADTKDSFFIHIHGISHARRPTALKLDSTYIPIGFPAQKPLGTIHHQVSGAETEPLSPPLPQTQLTEAGFHVKQEQEQEGEGNINDGDEKEMDLELDVQDEREERKEMPDDDMFSYEDLTPHREDCGGKCNRSMRYTFLVTTLLLAIVFYLFSIHAKIFYPDEK